MIPLVILVLLFAGGCTGEGRSRHLLLEIGSLPVSDDPVVAVVAEKVVIEPVVVKKKKPIARKKSYKKKRRTKRGHH